MRLHYIVPLCLVAIAPLAHADVYSFSYSGVSTGCADPGCTVYTASWDLGSPKKGTFKNVDVTSNIFEFPSATYTASAATTQPPSSQQSLNFFDDTGFEAAEFFPYTNFFNGPATKPIFIPGTYGSGAYFPSDGLDLTGTLAIMDLSDPSSVTPEPSTLALLGTGVLGAAGALRRRLRTL